MPINDTRWDSAHSAILSSYRTNPIGSRARPGYAYDIDLLGLDSDPARQGISKFSPLLQIL